MEQHEGKREFLKKHGIKNCDDIHGYHFSLGFYLVYMMRAMDIAEDIEDGICFDIQELSILLENLKKAKDTFDYFKEKKKYNFDSFDIAEVINLKGCRLEYGKLIGDKESASEIARMWVQDYIKHNGKPFAYEVGTYILFLLGEEIDYSF